MTPEVSDDEESKDVPSVSEEPTSLEPLPKRMKLSEMGMESEPIEVIKPIISPVTQVDSAENAASDGEASTEINSATLPSTPLDAAENEQLSETAHRSPVLTDGMGEEDSEVTPRITRTPVKGDTIRGEDSEEAPRITRTPAKADSMRDEDSEVAPTITRSPAKADAMAEEDSEVPPRITRPPEKADTMREESSEVTPRITRSMAAAASSKSGVGTESPAVASETRSLQTDETAPTLACRSPRGEETVSSLDESSVHTEEEANASSHKLKQPSLPTTFGSPTRRKINVDEWVRDGAGKYTREAVLLYERVQEEAQRKCHYRWAPPGDEIYRDVDKNISVFQVHGAMDTGCVLLAPKTCQESSVAASCSSRPSCSTSAVGSHLRSPPATDRSRPYYYTVVSHWPATTNRSLLDCLYTTSLQHPTRRLSPQLTPGSSVACPSKCLVTPSVYRTPAGGHGPP
ncbi:unnamed protein product [Heligmosomoides polygyrus]|uniref:ELM2 domain-containing protein n=1 Tax=Heligmosomoides polygyrus TaxID=6339 RepID=A0A3P8AT14_HELPZ|nr:unnamed protein product [Heligmosomoides polygyrus]